jgi:hypothetical protein
MSAGCTPCLPALGQAWLPPCGLLSSFAEPITQTVTFGCVIDGMQGLVLHEDLKARMRVLRLLVYIDTGTVLL